VRNRARYGHLFILAGAFNLSLLEAHLDFTYCNSGLGKVLCSMTILDDLDFAGFQGPLSPSIIDPRLCLHPRQSLGRSINRYEINLGFPDGSADISGEE
jgi:hypothetical protein